MLLTGHDEILRDALVDVPDFLKAVASFFSLSVRDVDRYVRLGAHIPDLPRLNYRVEKKTLTLDDIEVPEDIQALWTISQIKDSYSLTHYFHRGFNSFAHAMYSDLYRQHTDEKDYNTIGRLVLLRPQVRISSTPTQIVGYHSTHGGRFLFAITYIPIDERR